MSVYGRLVSSVGLYVAPRVLPAVLPLHRDSAAVPRPAQPALGAVVPGPVEGYGRPLGRDEGSARLRGGPEGGGPGDVGATAAGMLLTAATVAREKVERESGAGAVSGAEHVDRSGAGRDEGRGWGRVA